MKILLLLISLSILMIFKTSAQCSFQDSIKYEKAYCYVINDSVMSGKNIKISKALTTSFYIFFFNSYEMDSSDLELKQRFYEKDMDSIPINKSPCLKSEYFKEQHINSTVYKPLKFSEIKKINVSEYFKEQQIKQQQVKINVNMLLKFSELKGNDLFVSVRTMNFYVPNYEQTYYYYFCFDNYGEILRVSKLMMHGL